MERITRKHLVQLCDRLNQITGQPAEPYVSTDKGYVAQVGNYHISGAYGGYCLHQMSNEGGGVRCPIVNYHGPARELHGRMLAFMDGYELGAKAHE